MSREGVRSVLRALADDESFVDMVWQLLGKCFVLMSMP